MTHTVNDIRRLFIEFFTRSGHEAVASSPLVPQNDPTLMFTNAGMVQFKNVFTGTEKRAYKRAVTAQKCVRAGGKHNDLENVGYTARHHTFFEMLGNFSFGDYFKELAIPYAWELLTKDLGLPKEKLSFTVYHTDDEAFNLWKKVTGCHDSRILRIPTKDNFWAMGDTGPCGPCSEIFYDHGEKAGNGEWALNPDGTDKFDARFVEIWNLVFMQYEQVTPEERVPLPKPSIDTGMGLERISTVLQGVHDNYDIDLFKKLITAIADTAEQRVDDPAFRISYRVIADHLRACSFLIADGVTPSNEGRGYVLRRIMRRAMRHAHHLGTQDPLMHRLVPALVAEMGAAYPELTRAQALITETLRLEEERFRQTLGRGLKLLEEEVEKLQPRHSPDSAQQNPRGIQEQEIIDAAKKINPDIKKKDLDRPIVASGNAGDDGIKLPGDVAFKLYDTYGFPLDLTKDILRARDIAVDEAGFDACMEEQKARARAAWAGSGEKGTEKIWFALREKFGATEFLGYVHDKAEAQLLAIVKDGAEVPSARKGDRIAFIANQTPFYGESGGQLGDTGTTKTAKATLKILDTQKPVGDLFVHHAIVEEGEVAAGEAIELLVDAERRASLRAHHSATHLLHAALKRHLGAHVAQKGSRVAADSLRFDITHPKQITREELEKIEREVNHYIRQNTEAVTKLMPTDEAIKAGAVAMFGEKYGDEVRVLHMGLDEQKPYSVELCGGTHVRRTGDIGAFKIVSESAIAAGVRRIEALAGQAALDYLNAQEAKLQSAAALIKTPVDQLEARLATLLEERKKLEAELADARKKAALGGNKGGEASEQIGDITFLARQFEGLPPKDLRDIATDLRKKLPNGVVAAITVYEGKPSLIVGVSDALKDKLNAVDLVNAGAAILGGKGGGKPDMAQAGGSEAGKAAEALAAIKKKLTA